jgi:hypothetical protein
LKYAGSTSAPVLRLVAVALLGLAACRKAPPDGNQNRQGSAVAPAEAPNAADAAEPKYSPEGGCERPMPVYHAGRETGRVCPDQAGKLGLTVIDLSTQWAPRLFADQPSLGKKGKQPYRKTFLALQNEAFGDGPEFDRAKGDRFLELYGIFPTFSVLKKRLADDERHDCHLAIENEPLVQQKRPISPWRDRAAQQSDYAFAKTLFAQLDGERKRRNLETIEPLKGDRFFGRAYQQYERVGTLVAAISKMQEHLKCERLLPPKTKEGIIDYASAEALKAFQRKHMIVSWELDEETRAALVADSRELDFRSILRTLRERVIEATGVIEDGSARNERGLVLGRQLDAIAFRGMPKYTPMPNGAPDLVSSMTEEAAKALGWTGPAETRTFFDKMGDALEDASIAVRLPKPPAYHGKKMDLRAVIDRGDVYFDFPYTPKGERKVPLPERRPYIVLYAKDGDRDIALVRWPTTIGGWKPEKVRPKVIQMVYKESTQGERIWRDLVVSPVWVPPEKAPKRELVRPRYDGSWTLNTDLFGPGYPSAFGLVKLVHHRVAKMYKVQPKGDPIVHDEGIGTHGSVSYDSIHHGTSHGCHRLFNHQSIRLGSFLLAHREHKVTGRIELGYGRSVLWEGRSLNLKVENGGFKYELTPPVPVEVLKGRIMTNVTSPPKSKPLPESMLKQFAQERLEP